MFSHVYCINNYMVVYYIIFLSGWCQYKLEKIKICLVKTNSTRR